MDAVKLFQLCQSIVDVSNNSIYVFIVILLLICIGIVEVINKIHRIIILPFIIINLYILKRKIKK